MSAEQKAARSERQSDLRPIAVDKRQYVGSIGYVHREYREGLTVRRYETGTPDARRTQAIDEAHERNDSGRHRSGFCEACADNYVTLMEAPDGA